MSGEKKDLEYYNVNPDELADMSVEQLEELAAGESIANEGDTKSGEAPGAAAEGKTKETQEGKAASSEPGKPGEEKAEVGEGETSKEAEADILSKDGKHVLPFSVLQHTREEKARLEQIVHDQQAELDRLQTAAKEGEPANGGKAAAKLDGAEVLTEEQLVSIEEEIPALGKVLRAQQAMIGDLNGRLNADKEADEAAEQRRNSISVQTAIDSVPKLAHLQVADPEAFNAAVAIDNNLREHPKWAGKPYVDRFQAVVRVYEAAYGDIELPAAKSLPTPKQATPQSKPEAAPVRRGPASLSDLPGGAQAPVDEMARIEDASAVELTQRFEDMTPAQLDAYLAQFD